MAINSNNWGEIQIAANPKKKSIILELDERMGIKSIQETQEETKEERTKRIKEERGRKLGIIK